MRPHGIHERRFADLQRLIGERVERHAVDPDEARWFMLGRETVARQRQREWLARGAPRRRATDRAN
jgi:hypothetical protein